MNSSDRIHKVFSIFSLSVAIVQVPLVAVNLLKRTVFIKVENSEPLSIKFFVDHIIAAVAGIVMFVVHCYYKRIWLAVTQYCMVIVLSLELSLLDPSRYAFAFMM